MRKNLVLFVGNIFGLLVLFFFHNSWKLKEYLSKMKNQKGFIIDILSYVYEKHLGKKGAWIGINSHFDSKPIFPHNFYGIFISNEASIGKNCVIFQQVTIGSNTIKGSSKFGSPCIGDNCYIGAGAKIIGNIKIGNNCRIGANCVVTTDVPDNSVVVMPSPRIIQKENLDNSYITR